MATKMEQWVIIPNNDLLFHLSSVTSSFDPVIENNNLFITMEKCIKHTMLNDSITFLLFIITTPSRNVITFEYKFVASFLVPTQFRERIDVLF